MISVQKLHNANHSIDVDVVMLGRMSPKDGNEGIEIEGRDGSLGSESFGNEGSGMDSEEVGSLNVGSGTLTPAGSDRDGGFGKDGNFGSDILGKLATGI